MKQTITTEEAERFERIIWALIEKYFGVTVTPLDLPDDRPVSGLRRASRRLPRILPPVRRIQGRMRSPAGSADKAAPDRRLHDRHYQASTKSGPPPQKVKKVGKQP